MIQTDVLLLINLTIAIQIVIIFQQRLRSTASQIVVVIVAIQTTDRIGGLLGHI
jgi:hypothetical protein